MNKYYFTFGQDHAHSVNGFTFDKDVVVEIEAESTAVARSKMFDLFGAKWSMQYNDNPPRMDFFPRGIKRIEL